MATKARPRLRITKERLFYLGMALLIFALVFVGFAPTWFLRDRLNSQHPLPPLAPHVVLHGTLFTCWIGLFIVQASLISARQHKLHMKLGMASIALAAAMVVVGLLTAVRQPSAARFLTVPLASLITFAVLVAGGFACRRNPQAHKRLMLCATAVMLQPGVARIAIIPSFTIFDFLLADIISFLLATLLLGWDYVQRGRPHWATLVGLGVLALDQIVQVAIYRNKTWLAMADWFVHALT